METPHHLVVRANRCVRKQIGGGGDARRGSAGCISTREEFTVTFAEASERGMKEAESARAAAERERALFHPRSSFTFPFL